jgi:TonB family protein
MHVSLPTAMALLSLTLIVLPSNFIIAPKNLRVGMRGPLQILPEVDIIPEEEEDRNLTAAPSSAPTADFVSVELDYAVDPLRPPMPTQSPPPMERISEDPDLFSAVDDLQDAIRTTGHPVLAETDYELIYMQRPIYPREAVELGIEGEVMIMMLIDKHGRVSQAHVVNPDRIPILERAATDAVYKSLFRPHVVDGLPSPFWIRVPIQFRLVS